VLLTLAIFVLTLIGAMALHIPIAFSLLISSIFLLFHLNIFDTQILASTLIEGADNFPLMAIAFFILAGELMNAGGISKRIIAFAMALVGHVRGGLGYVAIMASVIFSGLSGSAVADTAAIGAVMVPIMVQAGYCRAKSVALIAAAGIIAPITPPSVPMIIFGVTGNVSIPKLFMSGIVPGLMLAAILAVTWTIIIRKEKDFKVQPKKTGAEIWEATKGAVWAFVLPILIIFCLRGGIFTPTEAAAIAAVYALFVGVIIYRDLKLNKITEVLVNSAKTTSVVMFLASAAMVTSWLIAVANIPPQIATMLEPLIDNRLLLMLAVSATLLIIGTCMDATPTILILTPVLLPIAIKAGIDPVYFGLIFIFNNMISVLTPPVGTVLNVACGVGKITMEELIRNIWPYLIAQVTLLVILILFPQIVITPMNFFMGGR
jgi:tripartite ATP-independent transporter DctM subunit